MKYATSVFFTISIFLLIEPQGIEISLKLMMTGQPCKLLIEPQGIEIFEIQYRYKDATLLIEPQGIEIHLVVVLIIPPVVLLIEPQGIEI